MAVPCRCGKCYVCDLWQEIESDPESDIPWQAFAAFVVLVAVLALIFGR